MKQGRSLTVHGKSSMTFSHDAIYRYRAIKPAPSLSPLPGIKVKMSTFLHVHDWRDMNGQWP